MLLRLSLNSMGLFCKALALSLTLFILFGCATPKEKKLEKEKFTLTYRHKSQAGPEIEKMNMEHPVKISEEEFNNHLFSLQYEELSLLGKKKYVFSHQDMSEISRLLLKAVHHLVPEKILILELETPRGATHGEIFAAGGKLNFRFQSIKGSEFSGNSFSGWGGSVWRLVPVKGQQYHVTKRLLGTSTQENWIVADMNLPKKSRRLVNGKNSEEPEPSSGPSPSPASPPAEKNVELEKKLQFLKDLREKNLIDDEEYEKKRRELLDSYL